MSGRTGVGVVGAGVISQTYLENLGSFPDVEVLAVGDLQPERAEAHKIETAIETVDDDGLREALRRLGHGIMRRERD